MSEYFITVSFYIVLVLGIITYALLISATAAVIVSSAIWLIKQICAGVRDE